MSGFFALAASPQREIADDRCGEHRAARAFRRQFAEQKSGEVVDRDRREDEREIAHPAPRVENDAEQKKHGVSRLGVLLRDEAVRRKEQRQKK